MPYPMEFRVLVAAAYDACGSSIEVAEEYDCCESWVRRLVQRRRTTGSLAPLTPTRPDRRKLDDDDLEHLRGADRRQARHDAGGAGRGAGPQGVGPDGLAGDAGAGPAAQIKTEHAAEQDRPDVKEARGRWFERFAGMRLDRFVFLDEFGATTDMARRYARGPRGERVVCKTPRGYWKVLSTIAAMTVNGVLGYGTFDGATDTETLLVFLREGLVPHLLPGQVVVLDNLPAHRSPRVDELIESAGAKVLRLPPNSPDFNPIEMAIPKVKSVLRKLARRTVDGLLAAIDEAVAAVTADDSRAFIRH